MIKLKVEQYELPHVKRVALLADTHGPLNPLLLASIKSHEYLIHAGDVGQLNEELVAEMPFLAVRGNNDVPSKWAPGNLDKLSDLPDCLCIKIAGGELIIIHGHQFSTTRTRHERLRKMFPQAKAIVYGHSHRFVIDKTSSPWILNPGAGGKVRAYGGAGFISLSGASRGWRLRHITA